MSANSLCRVCLVDTMNLHSVRNNLQNVYERLTSEKFNKVGYPVHMCYICLTVLRKCHKFMETAQDTNNVLKQWYNQQNEMRVTRPLYTYSISKTELVPTYDKNMTSQNDIEVEKVESEQEEVQAEYAADNIDVIVEKTDVDEQTDHCELLVDSPNDCIYTETIGDNNDRQTYPLFDFNEDFEDNGTLALNLGDHTNIETTTKIISPHDNDIPPIKNRKTNETKPQHRAPKTSGEPAITSETSNDITQKDTSSDEEDIIKSNKNGEIEQDKQTGKLEMKALDELVGNREDVAVISYPVIKDSSKLSLVSDGSFSGIIYELQGSDQNEVETQPDRDKIRSILNNTHRGRALLSSPQAVSGLLDSSQRKELAHLLLDSVLEANPNTQLKWSDFQSWARGIGELFKNESPVIYYAAYIAGGPFQAKKNASGILYNTYLRKRKNLIKRNVTTPFRKRRATSDSSDLSDVEPARPTCPLIDLSIIDEIESDRVEDASLAITLAVEGATPWNEIAKLWAITAKARLQKLYNEKGTLQDYLDEYQILKGPNGYKLLLEDFDRLYPATGADILRNSIQKVCGNIIDKGKTLLASTKNQFLKLALTELLTASIDEDSENAKLDVSLLLLPLLMNITPLKGRGLTKTSKAVIRDNFILRVPSGANLESRLADHRETLRVWKITFQPIVVYTGESVTSIEKCYVVVEDTHYELPSLIAAVDVAFKIFQATAAEYPILAHDIWLFIQKGFYNVETRHDRISHSVKTFLVDLGLKERC